jgi:choline dehydrogenase-like flavoprotein
MKINANELSNKQEIISDVCIIGAGPAGMSLANEFLNSDLKVSFLESGGSKYIHQVQMLSQGPLSGHLYEPQETTHLRQIGGTANNWILQMTDDEYGYRYTPLDEVDFEQRDSLPYSGWPITKKELDPYYARAHATCGVGQYDYTAKYWARGKFQPLKLDESRVYNSVFTFGPTKKFTDEIPKKITQSSNLTLYHQATVVELLCDESGSHVTTAVVRMFDGKEIYFKAKQFIISSNALQTPRLLLNSTKTHKKGIGNQHDNVGRYFMDHNLVPSGNFYPHDPKLINEMGFYDMQGVDGTTVLGRMNLNADLVKKVGLRNMAVMLFPIEWSQVDLDAMNSVNALKLPDFHLKTAPRYPIDVAKHLMRLVSKPKDLLIHLRNIFRGRNRLFRAIYEYLRYGVPISLGLGRGGWSRMANNEGKYNKFELLAIVEQSPNPENRLTVTEEKDELGCPKAKLHYICSDEDIESVKKAQKIFGEMLEATGLGRYEPAKVSAEVMKTLTGLHHMMGTTRMSNDPKNGVVDANCCVHGMHNLFIAGSATFPTGGYANPTLTNIALSIRVADKVKSLLAAK